MSGSATCKPRGNNINIADINPSNLAISGGTTAGGNFKIGNQAQTIIANVNAATMTIGSGSDTKITGTLTASGQITWARTPPSSARSRPRP
jgi:MSHA biogenesis protein MshQ